MHIIKFTLFKPLAKARSQVTHYMDWQRLDRKATEDLIQKSGSASVLFSPQTSEARRSPLPFLDNFAMYRLTNYAALPLISLDYLVNESNGDPNGVLYLDGSTAPILKAIRSDNFSLDIDNVIGYVNFYFKNAPDPDGDIYIINDLESLVFFDLLGQDQQDRLTKNFKAPVAEQLEDGRYQIKACMVNQGSLVTATVAVLGDGTVNISSVAMMVRSTPAYHRPDD
jgi:hypothetical protein